MTVLCWPKPLYSYNVNNSKKTIVLMHFLSHTDWRGFQHHGELSFCSIYDFQIIKFIF